MAVRAKMEELTLQKFHSKVMGSMTGSLNTCKLI